jgi:hypothetical protein
LVNYFAPPAPSLSARDIEIRSAGHEHPAFRQSRQLADLCHVVVRSGMTNRRATVSA